MRESGDNSLWVCYYEFYLIHCSYNNKNGCSFNVMHHSSTVFADAKLIEYSNLFDCSGQLISVLHHQFTITKASEGTPEDYKRVHEHPQKETSDIQHKSKYMSCTWCLNVYIDLLKWSWIPGQWSMKLYVRRLQREPGLRISAQAYRGSMVIWPFLINWEMKVVARLRSCVPERKPGLGH